MSDEKIRHLKELSTDEGVIAALAIDQRNSLRKPIAAARGVPLEAVTGEMLAEFKSAVTRILGPYASAVLLDPEYGLEAAKARPRGTGLLLTYEADGFENPRPNRMLALLPRVSVRRLKEWGANGVKVLLSYNPFDDPRVNDEKHAAIERIGNECDGAGVPFLLEFVGYDLRGDDESRVEFARTNAEIVIRSMREFSRDVYKVDVMKVPAPVNLALVEATAVYTGRRAHSYREALALFRRAGAAASRPFIYLSAGVGNRQFIESLRMAAEAGAEFSGVLCGRATWKDGIPAYAKHGLRALEDWLADEGVKNIRAVNDAIRGATPWFDKLGLSRSVIA
ncbi:MAG: tagatose 1,6-diphosphate aldolase [Acidobacteriota bacterium]